MKVTFAIVMDVVLTFLALQASCHKIDFLCYKVFKEKTSVSERGCRMLLAHQDGERSARRGPS
ncbi:hypothetical protein [Billgrantia endophytica]|uniref:hypothetical protein n=1 Tax=Billgrantia endophytica TaxID=2033802 RepID=UPI001056CB06|nr:hypothetical protein [Halomonas endophytica]